MPIYNKGDFVIGHLGNLRLGGIIQNVVTTVARKPDGTEETKHKYTIKAPGGLYIDTEDILN